MKNTKKTIITLIGLSIVLAGCVYNEPAHHVVVPAHSTTVVKTNSAVVKTSPTVVVR